MAAFGYYDYGTTATSGVVTITFSVTSTGTNLSPPPEPSAEELRRWQLRQWTLAALLAARLALRTGHDDPTGVLPRRPRRKATERLHERPRIRGRVCAGSSRYRVLWA